MKLFRIFAAGALSYVAYRAWQRQKTPTAPSAPRLDAGARTAPHGDPVRLADSVDLEPAPSFGAQSSRSFGET
ncbi:hypothetical protein ACF3M1_01540 [Luteimonas sp. WGS1318]|uniref:hypothetical protein n=1 Tax=Luteimonas sp. WGS1318 TaxID=3366815 RepID=UPI00372D2D62